MLVELSINVFNGEHLVSTVLGAECKFSFLLTYMLPASSAMQ